MAPHKGHCMAGLDACACLETKPVVRGNWCNEGLLACTVYL